MSSEGILLESGTNEVEILEFLLDGQSFGVNVLKIQAIEQYDPERVTHVQLAHPSVVGTLLFRDQCITLVDLTREIGPESADEASESGEDAVHRCGAGNRLVLVMEFNRTKTAFLVDGVDRIHRVSWESFNPISSYLNTVDSKFTGSLAIDGREILIVDMEKVVTDILPDGRMEFRPEAGEDAAAVAERGARTVLLAEDSAVIRDRVAHELARGGYTELRSFPNGSDCLDELKRLSAEAAADGETLSSRVAAVITDIEMPVMDGLALCRNVKGAAGMNGVPVIVFSSLINDQIARKCEAVEADAYLAKPEVNDLVALLDEHTGVTVV